MNQSAKIKHEILKQLKYGACCRSHIHRECCHRFGLEELGVNRTEDTKFDNPFNELIKDRLIRKIHVKTMHIDGAKVEMKDVKTVERIGDYAFYELTKKGRTLINAIHDK